MITIILPHSILHVYPSEDMSWLNTARNTKFPQMLLQAASQLAERGATALSPPLLERLKQQPGSISDSYQTVTSSWLECEVSPLNGAVSCLLSLPCRLNGSQESESSKQVSVVWLHLSD